MRDALVFALVFGSLPLIVRRPWFGVLVWYWLAFMSPHRLCYGPAWGFNFSMYVGVVLLGAWVLRGEKKIPMTPVAVAMLAFFLWTSITTLAALDDESAAFKFDAFFKIILITFVTMAMINDRHRLHVLIWVASLSLGFYGIKGGYFTITTGGSQKVYGPAKSIIADNNQLAMALITLLPCFRYLQMHAGHKYLRWALGVCMFLIFAAVLGSQSRGALLGVSAMGFFLWLKSRNKFAIAIVSIIAILFVFNFMPESWFKRMDTIGDYNQDNSAQGRIDAWTFSVKMANSRFLGGGFGIHGNTQVYWRVYPEGTRPRASHSVYFEVLGEHGWVGLMLFLTVLAAAWFSFGTTAKLARRRPELTRIRDLCLMLQVSLIGYSTAGTFLNLSTFDLYWLFIGIAAISSRIVRDTLAEAGEEPPAAEAPAAPASAAPAMATGGVSGFLVKQR